MRRSLSRCYFERSEVEVERSLHSATRRSLQSKTRCYSLKPVNDSMRPPHVLLLSDSNPYSPKVNSMM